MANQTMIGVGFAGVDADADGVGLTLFGFRVGASRGRGLEFGVNAPIGITVVGQGVGAQARADVSTSGQHYARVGMDSLGATAELVDKNGKIDCNLGWRAFIDAKPQDHWSWGTLYDLTDAKAKMRELAGKGHLLDLPVLNCFFTDDHDIGDLMKYFNITRDHETIKASARISNVDGFMKQVKETQYYNAFTAGIRVTVVKLVYHRKEKKASFFVHTEKFDTFRPFGIFDGLDGSGQREVGKKLQLSINSGDNWTRI